MGASLQYDWLGNTSTTGDDASGFYDRSLGTITNGTATAGPYQLTAANGGTGARGGSLTSVYDAAGNLTSMAVDRNGLCSPLASSCHQRFAYDWDEVGRLSRARRWDLLLTAGTASSPLPTGAANVQLLYTYDASDGRVLKTAVDVLGNKLFTAYIFGSLELRRVPASGNDYARTTLTGAPYEVAYSVRLARLHYAEELIPATAGQTLHVLLEMPDHLGSTSIVVDSATSEVVERGTYMAYGQAESDYRPARWGQFREDYKFTGKEEDVEVGLQYFGKRFLSAQLNRWVSADPLTIHGIGEDINAYAYVHGRVLSATDPLGLQEVCPKGMACGNPSGSKPPAGSDQDTALDKWLDQNPRMRKVVEVALFAGALVMLKYDIDDFARNITNIRNDLQEEEAIVSARAEAAGGAAGAKPSSTPAATPEPIEVPPPRTSTPPAVREPPPPPAAAQDKPIRDAAGRLRNANGTFAFDGGPKRVVSQGTHGNVAGSQEAALYKRFDAQGNFLKWGISQDPSKRYTKAELNGGYLVENAAWPAK